MKRLATLVCLLLLAGCAHGGRVPEASAPPVRGTAYVDVEKIKAPSALRRALTAYDREIAALRATQAVPQLRDTRGIVERQEQVVRNGAREATATLDAIRLRVANVNGERFASADLSRAQYHAALQTQASQSLSLYRDALRKRIDTAYGNRVRQLSEHEAALEISLDRAVADRRLQLKVKLQNLKAPYVNRGRIRDELDAMDASIRRKLDALHARDAATLSAYRTKLQAQAARDDDSMARRIASNTNANWRLRERVAAGAPPPFTPLPVSANDADFTRAAGDIATRFAAIASADVSARGDAANEIIALQRDRSAAILEFHRTVAALASELARSRGLRIDSGRPPGAVDLTPQVQALVARLFD